jgi:hypothetical protein
MIMDHIYGRISYHSCLVNHFKLILRHIPTVNLSEMKQATKKQITDHLITTAKVISGSRVKTRCV